VTTRITILPPSGKYALSDFVSPVFTARCYAERQYVVCLSVCPSVSDFQVPYRDHIGWNTEEIISRPNSLRYLLTLTPTWAIWCNGNIRKIRVRLRADVFFQAPNAPKPVFGRDSSPDSAEGAYNAPSRLGRGTSLLIPSP